MGIMKGIIAGIKPDVQLIDLNHQIPPGDIQQAAVTLWQSCNYFPKGTIFLAVVDPGVGTQRRPIILQADEYTFVGPDNGVLSFVMGDTWKAWELANPNLMLSNPGNTFHGRDIFAPAAAHVSKGIPGPKFGDPILELVRLSEPKLESPSQGILRGEILHSDHFGNLLTSLGKFTPDEENWVFSPWMGSAAPKTFSPTSATIELPNGTKLPWVQTFGDIPPNECAALVGSSGLIEIAANRRSATEMLELAGGEIIHMEFST